MRVTLSHKQYVELVRRGEPPEYPVSTTGAASQLRSRFYDANVDILIYLCRKGKVSPARDGRNRQWTAEDINQAAQALDEQCAYTPNAAMNIALGISSVKY
ncbi:MAG: hypothetical protein KatS3mg109_1688 [Pirellulaceae bacterium]|nr:MAG: hypothetical protein KatS3mg109_1688 [Pirellulaceae bacterium]